MIITHIEFRGHDAKKKKTEKKTASVSSRLGPARQQTEISTYLITLTDQEEAYKRHSAEARRSLRATYKDCHSPFLMTNKMSNLHRSKTL